MSWKHLHTSKNFQIYNPKGEVIMQGRNNNIESFVDPTVITYMFYQAINTLTLKLLHVSKSDNGTYVYATEHNIERRGITLVVLGKYSQTVYKGHSRDHENVSFMNSCPLYTGENYMYYYWE